MGNGSPVLEQVGPLIGSMFVGAVAVFAAVLAAKTANRRQKEQLRSAAREQMRALEKDQRLNNRDAFRAVATLVLGRCIDAQNEFNDVATRAVGVAGVSGTALEADRKADVLDKADPAFLEMKKAAERLHITAMKDRLKFQDAEKTLRDTQKEVIYDNVRISVLVGVDDEVTRAHWQFVLKLGSAVGLLGRIAASSDSGADSIIDGAREELAGALGDFRDAVLNELNRPLWDEEKFRSDDDRRGMRWRPRWL